MKKLAIILMALGVLFLGFYLYSNFKMKVNDPDYLNEHFAEIEDYFMFRDEKNAEVSQVDVAWHLDHMLKTINNISDALKASDPSKFENGLNPIGRVSLTINFIPRGQAQSPNIVLPPEVIRTEDLVSQLADARAKIQEAFKADEDAHFKHPVFGTINKDPSLRFIEVHTEHHLKIIRDILGK